MMSKMHAELGFTLLEVLMALTVFALIAGVSYTALGPAGEGFKQLQDVRDRIAMASWIGKQLRADVSGVSQSALKNLHAIQMSSDIRGETHVDELKLLVREAGRSGLTLVHYRLDEETGELIRESRMAWARDRVKSDDMVLGKVSSFNVEVMDKNGQWKQRLPPFSQQQATFSWPRALRVSVSQGEKSQHWMMPIYQGLQ